MPHPHRCMGFVSWRRRTTCKKRCDWSPPVPRLPNAFSRNRFCFVEKTPPWMPPSTKRKPAKTKSLKRSCQLICTRSPYLHCATSIGWEQRCDQLPTATPHVVRRLIGISEKTSSLNAPPPRAPLLLSACTRKPNLKLKERYIEGYESSEMTLLKLFS